MKVGRGRGSSRTIADQHPNQASHRRTKIDHLVPSSDMPAFQVQFDGLSLLFLSDCRGSVVL